ncbi:unnamed protein product, partial [Symbiodinium microadriaticum]
LVSASQVASDSDLRSLLTTMQSEITRLKALLDVKPAASPAKASVEPEEGEPQGEKDEEGEEDGEECDEGNEEEGEEDEEEQHAVFAQWLEKEMNMGNTEAQLIITKSKSAEVKSGYEELTVKEMVTRGFSATKIESIVRKGGTPDPDAPHCLESIVYLCRKKNSVDESEKISQTGEVKGKIKATAKAVAPLMHLTGLPAPSGATSGSTEAVLQMAANVFAAGTESALSGLEVLIACRILCCSVLHLGEAGAAPKKLPKAKAKAKAKAVLQAPKTLKDRLEDCRKELKKEYNAANICYDLPKTDKLRTEMEKHKGDLENKMDLMKELDDEDAEVRAVVAELQRKEAAETKSCSTTSILRDELDQVGAMARAGHLDMLVADWDMVPGYWSDEATAVNEQWMKSSGFDTYIVQQWVLHEISSVADSGLDGNLVLALWASNHCISLWSNNGTRWLSDDEKRNVREAGVLYLRSYISLAEKAIEEQRRLYRIRPKLHLLHHLFIKDGYANPHCYATWMDEDAL